MDELTHVTTGQALALPGTSSGSHHKPNHD
jgi:hypothetical protein